MRLTRLIMIALLACATLLAHAERTVAPVLVGEGKLTHVAHSRQKAGRPSIERASNGRLWATWFASTQTSPENLNDYVVLATSADGGETWEDVFVADPDLYSNNTRRAFDPQVWIDPDGVLRWFWTDRTGVSATNTTSAATDGVWMAVVGDATLTPSAAPSDVRCIWSGAVGGKPFVLDDGAWGFPVAQLFSSPSALLVVSTDKCASFSLRGGATVPAAIGNSSFPQIVPLSATEVRCWAHTPSGTFESASTDGGATWPEMAATTSFQNGYDSGRCCVRRLASGNLLLVKRGALASANGEGLYAFVSTDGGATWTGGLQLDSRDKVYYPDAIQGAGGMIHVIYECDGTVRREILMASFQESDALAATDSSKTVRLAQPVSEPSYPLNTVSAQVVGQALSGDGTTAAAICTDTGIPVGANSPYTIEAWVNPSAYATENRVVGQYAGGATGRMLIYVGNNSGNGGSNDKLGVFFGGGNGYNSYRYLSTASIPLNQWTHIALAQNNRDTRMYINGVLDSVHNHAGPVAGVPNCPFTIGGIVSRASEGGNIGLFKGKLAEIRVWKRARNAGEISHDYRHRLCGFEQDLIGYWRLDDIDAFSIFNTVTRQKNMIPQNGHLSGVVEETLALVPRAQRTWNNDSLRFGAKNNQYLTSDVTLGANDAYTFEAWVRPCGYGAENRILGVYVAGKNGRELFELRQGKVGMYAHVASGNIYPSGGDVLPQYTWTHVAMSRSMSEVRFFVNGVRVATESRTFYPTLEIPVTIGGAPGNSSFNGDIRDVRIWSGIRSDEDISTNYWRRLTGGEDGLLGYWPLDKNSGNIVTNLVTGAPCTNTGVSVTWLNGLAIPELVDEPSEAIEGNRWVASFVGKYGSTYTATELKLTNDFTIESWVYPTLNANRSIIASQFSGTDNGRMLFSLNNLKLSIGIWDASNARNAGDWISDTAAVPLNQWTHVAATRAGDTVTIYRNGVAVKSVSNFVDSPILQSKTLRIASREGPSSDSFDGSLAEVRIWNKACSGDEIRRAMSHKLRGTEPGLLGYFPLDEGSGTVMTNLARNASNGTIVSMWSWANLQLEEPLPPGGAVIVIR